MGTEVDVNLWPGPAQAFNVALTTVDATPFKGSGTLFGWSLREASSEVASDVTGTVVAPGAGATIVTTGALAAGTYDVNWSVELQGPAAAADANNFQLFNGAGAVVASINAPVAGVYPQPAARITVAAGATVSVKAIGAGTAGVSYTADLAVVPNQFFGMAVELQSGNTVLGESAADLQETDTVWMGPQGIVIDNQVTVHVVAGTVTGTLYITPNY